MRFRGDSRQVIKAGSEWEDMDSTWKFDQSQNCAVFTLRGIIQKGEPVLYVSHDESDHGWQFLDGRTPRIAEAMVVAFEEMISHDPTLNELHDLPVGWIATRAKLGGAWKKMPHP